MNKNTTIIAIIVIVIIGGIFFLFTKKVEVPTAEQGIPDVGGATSAVPAPGFKGTVEEMVVVPFTETPGTNGKDPDEDVAREEPSAPPTQLEIPQAQSVGVTTVTYTSDGFSPQSITISKGDTVRFVNESSGRMWIGSDIHPTHTLYPAKSGSDCLGSSFDQCGTSINGESWEFTFSEEGEWRFHNHVRASKRGVIIVK